MIHYLLIISMTNHGRGFKYYKYFTKTNEHTYKDYNYRSNITTHTQVSGLFYKRYHGI